MKTTKFFAKMLTIVTMLAVVFLSSCEAGSENEDIIPKPGPTPTELSFNLLEDGVVDSTYTVGVSSLYTKGHYALVYNIINKKTNDKIGETKTYLAPYLASTVLTVTGDKVKVSSKALDVYDIQVSETVKGNPVKNTNSYRYNTEKKITLKIKTVAENGAEAKDVVVSGKLVFPRDEVFFDGEDNRILDVANLGVKSVEYSKFTLDSLKAKTDKGQEAYYSFHFNVTRQANFYASKRYDWGNKMKTRASVDGEEVEVSNSVFYNDPEAKTETVKAVVMLYVPEDGKEPNETGKTYEDDKLVKKDDNYYTSSNDKYTNYDNDTKVLDKHNEVDINIFAGLDSDPDIFVTDNITNVGNPTLKEASATKTSRTVGEYFIEKQPKTWTWSWAYGKGNVSRVISTIEEYPYIVDGSKKIKMLSSNWKVTLKNTTMGAAVDYTHNGKKGKLYTQKLVWEAVYYNETRTFTGEVRYFVEASEEAKQTGWDIFNSDYKKVNDSFYNTFGDLYKIFDDGTKTLSEALSQDYAVSAIPDADGNIFTIPAKANIGTPSLKTADGTKTNRTSGKFFIENQPKTWTFSWSGNTGVVRKVSTIEEYVYYMAGANKLQMKTGTWSKVEVAATVDAGTSYTHNGTKGTLFTEKLVFKATYGSEVRTLATRYNKYFVAEPDPAVVTVSEVSKDYTLQSADVKSWINFDIKTTYNGQTTSKDSIATDYLNFGFEAAANKNFKKSAEGLDVSTTNVSKSTSVAGTKTTNKLNLDVNLKFVDGSTSTITFPGFYTTGYATVRGKQYQYKAPQMSVAYTNIAKVGNTTTVEEGGKLYKRSTYTVSAVATIDNKTISRETTITVDAEVKQQINPEKGAFKGTYETYAPSLDNKLHRAILFVWEKKIDMIADGVYQETVNNPDPSKTYQSLYCVQRNQGSNKPWTWVPATLTTPVSGWWRYTNANDPNAIINWSWQINGSFEGITLKEGDWNQAGHTNIVKSIDEDGYTVITAYNADGTIIYQSK